jgi:hypothetical protein
VPEADGDGQASGAPSLAELLHRGNLDELVREVDRLAAVDDHEGLLVLRERCHEAAETIGKQLWGPAQYAEYRLALEAPGPLAASVVTPGAARFALGPLTEVVAQDLRTGISLVLAGLVADGETVVTNGIMIDRGHADLVERFSALGADIRRVVLD